MSLQILLGRRQLWTAFVLIVSMVPTPSMSESSQQHNAGSYHELAVGDLTMLLPTLITFQMYRKDREAPVGRTVSSGETPLKDSQPLDSLAIALEEILPEVKYGGLVFIERNNQALFADTYCKYLAKTRGETTKPEPVTEGVVRLRTDQLGEMYIISDVSFLGRPTVLLSSPKHFIDVNGQDFGQTYYLLAALRRDVLLSLQFLDVHIPRENWIPTLNRINEKLGAWLVEPGTTFQSSARGVVQLACKP
jgi:hypothetical protein